MMTENSLLQCDNTINHLNTNKNQQIMSYLDSLLATWGVVWVRTVTGPPYGVIGYKCVVPLTDETVTHLESHDTAISWIRAVVSPLKII